MATRRNDPAYVERRDALKRKARKQNLPCHLCGEPIDYTADYRARLAFTADHEEAVATGGRMTGVLKPAHRSCNSRRGKKNLGEYRAGMIQPPTTGSAW